MKQVQPVKKLTLEEEQDKMFRESQMKIRERKLKEVFYSRLPVVSSHSHASGGRRQTYGRRCTKTEA